MLMGRGSLVVKKNPWGIDSANVGVILEEGGASGSDRVWRVLWSSKIRYKIQEHLENALIEVSENASG